MRSREKETALVKILTCSLVIDKFPYFTLHDCQCLSSLLLLQQTQLLQVRKRQQVLYTITLKHETTHGNNKWNKNIFSNFR